jgi:hypothetical protein
LLAKSREPYETNVSPEAAFRIDVVTLERFRVVILRNHGAYSKLDEVYDLTWAHTPGLMTRTTRCCAACFAGVLPAKPAIRCDSKPTADPP